MAASTPISEQAARATFNSAPSFAGEIQKILRSALEIPVAAGPLTLYYSKWMPADHSPDGPITNLAGLKFTANGQRLAWHRDPDDIFAIHLDIPAGITSISAHIDFLLSAPGPTIDFSAAAS